MVYLLFDYDGTLHDSLHIYAPAVRAACDRLTSLGLIEPRTWSGETLKGWIGLPPEEMWDRALPGLPTAVKRDAIALVGQRMLELVRSGQARLYEGVPEVLSALQSDGYRLLLLSNCPTAYLEAHRDHFRLDRFFDGLFCGEQFGYLPKYQIFRRLRRQYDGPFLVIGDRAQDMEIARRNGVMAVGCLYGYGDGAELSAADRTAASPAALPGCIRQLLPADGR